MTLSLTGFSAAEHLPLISGEAGEASAGLRHRYLRLGCERIRVESRGSGGT